MSPVGTAEVQIWRVFSRPYGTAQDVGSVPSDESLGYFRVVPTGTTNVFDISTEAQSRKDSFLATQFFSLCFCGNTLPKS